MKKEIQYQSSHVMMIHEPENELVIVYWQQNLDKDFDIVKNDLNNIIRFVEQNGLRFVIFDFSGVTGPFNKTMNLFKNKWFPIFSEKPTLKHVFVTSQDYYTKQSLHRINENRNPDDQYAVFNNESNARNHLVRQIRSNSKVA